MNNLRKQIEEILDRLIYKRGYETAWIDGDGNQVNGDPRIGLISELTTLFQSQLEAARRDSFIDGFVAMNRIAVDHNFDSDHEAAEYAKGNIDELTNHN